MSPLMSFCVPQFRCSRSHAFAVFALATVLWCGIAEVRAGLVINAQQVGADVVATLTGSFNTAVASVGTTDYFQNPPVVIGGDGFNSGFFFSNAFASGRVWEASNVSAPFPTFGSGGLIETAASSSSISANNLWFQFQNFESALLGVLTVAQAYNGSSLNDSMTFANKTMPQLGLGNYGSYVFTFGSGGTTDTVTVNLINPVPEPATYAMALAGLACGGFSMWRRRKRA